MRAPTSFLVVCLLLVASAAAADVLITEVYYCHGPVDDGYEWIELFNASINDIPLDGYVLGHGGSDYTWSVITFGPDDVIPACGTFVVGGPFSEAGNAFPVFDLALDIEQDLQNGGLVADGVALFAPGANPTVDTPLDAVLYGEENSSGLLDRTGLAAAPHVGNVTGYGVSIARTSEAGNWVVEPAPNPNAVGFIPEICEPIGAADQSWGTMKSRFDR